MNRPRARWLAAILPLWIAGPASAASLLDVYRDALASDPQYAAAQANRRAGEERSTQGLAGLLPSVTASANTVYNDNEFNGTPRSYNSNGWELRLTQPLFRWQNWVGYQQGKLQTLQSEAQLQQARQDLILRVTQAYFDVQVAHETLAALQAQKLAISQQLELAKKSYEVGTATITDTHEAQSRYDLAVAQEIAAQSDLEIKQRALQAITGKEYPQLDGLPATAPLASPQPADLAPWVAAAERDNPAVVAQQAAADIAGREAERARAGHLPTVDLIATAGYQKSGASQVSPNASEADLRTIGVYLNVPLYQGGAVSSRSREAAAQREAALAALDNARRQSAQGARQSYLGVVNGLSQVRALDAALASSKASLEANRLGYQVGVRINIDVLNAEQQLSSTRRDLAKARYDTLLAQLRLKSTVGALDDAAVEQVSALMGPLSAGAPATPVAPAPNEPAVR